MDSLTNRLAGKGYGQLKEEAAQATIEAVKPIQERYNALIKDKDYMAATLGNSAERAQYLAGKTLRKVYKKLGFIPKA